MRNVRYHLPELEIDQYMQQKTSSFVCSCVK